RSPSRHRPTRRRRPWTRSSCGPSTASTTTTTGAADVDVTATLDAPCSPEDLFPWVADLDRYPQWLDIVPRAVPVDAHADDAGPAWSVDLRGRLGPFARSKRLR